MKKLVFEIKHLIKINLDLVDFPELESKKKWVQKGLNILKKHTPRVLKYLSKQSVISSLRDYDIEIKTEKQIDDEHIRRRMKIWIHKEKTKRIFLLFIEAILIPFTGLLAILPGPNFFFYVPALLFYYHLISYIGLKKVEVDHLNIKVLSSEKKSNK